MHKTLLFLGLRSSSKTAQNLEVKGLNTRQKIFVIAVSLLMSAAVFYTSHLIVRDLGSNFKLVPISLSLFSLILLVRQGNQFYSPAKGNPKKEN